MPLVILSWTGYQEIQYPETNVVHPIGILSSKYPSSYPKKTKVEIEILGKGIKVRKVRIISKVLQSIYEYINSCPFNFKSDSPLFLGKNKSIKGIY